MRMHCPLPPAGRKLHRHMQIPAAAVSELGNTQGNPTPSNMAQYA